MPDEEFDEGGCLRRIENGDEAAARELIRHFYSFVLKLVRSHLPRRTSEEDLVQMIFIKIFRYLPSYGGRMPLEHWVSRVAVNTCLNELKAEKIRPEWRLADFDEEAAAAIERLARDERDVVSREDLNAAKILLARLMTQLSPKDRLVVTLLHVEERSVDEIHALTGWSRASVKVRAFRARARMKKMLKKSDTLNFA